MKKIFLLATVLLSLLMYPLATPVEAAAYGTSFTTSVTYQNVGNASANNIIINFYPEINGTPITINRPPLAPGAGTSIYIGGLTEIASGFKGSAVIESDQPLVATLVQVPPASSPLKARPLSNGFSSGAPEVGIPTVLKNTFGVNSMVVIQNVDTVAADLTLDFVPVSGATINLSLNNLPPGAAKYYDLGQLAQLGASFNGALKIKAFQAGTTNPGSIVATSMELGISSNAAYAFEGVGGAGSNKVYMPSALCKFSTAQQTTAYAVQNVSTTDVQVTVTYSSGNTEGPYTISAGGKRSFDSCAVNSPGFLGSAVIEASGGNIVGIGKVYGGGLYTAFLGFNEGGSKVALPYIRYTQTGWLNGTRQRSFIAIQNVGDVALSAGSVSVKYYDKNGTLVGTHVLGEIPSGGKVNSNPSMIGAAGDEFGYYPDGTYGGSAIVEGPTGSKLAVVVRVQTYVSSVEVPGEDYTGISVP